MQEDQQYLVPDYYPAFRCKQGSCRTPCCEGWPISFSMQDYFRLLSIPCSDELRRRLDGAMHLCDHPTPDHYAQISPRFDGQCPMHQPDGLCRMHAELGEEMLSAVCRLYPRGIRTGSDREASCANSCEAVPEMLLSRFEPLGFQLFPVRHCLPDTPPRIHHFHTAGREQEIRLWLISHLQNRAYSLPRRMLLLGEAASPELRELIVDYISVQPKVLGYHDLMVHDYGPGQRFASLHVEMDQREDPLMCHELIDDMERECLQSHGIHLVIHYDPVVTNDPELDRMRQLVLAILRVKDSRISIHDFRMVPGAGHTNLIFDVALPVELRGQEETIRGALETALNDLGQGKYYTVITFDPEEFN